jgi:hypothetical protein
VAAARAEPGGRHRGGAERRRQPRAAGARRVVRLHAAGVHTAERVVYGSGLVPLPEMVRSGFILDIVGAVLIWVTLRLLCPLFGVM